MPVTLTEYPFDPTGLKPENKITGEQHILTTVNEKHYRKIVPRWAPIFQAGLKVRGRRPDGTIKNFVEGVDYYLGHHFLSASRATGKPIYGSINILDDTFIGTIILDQYQTLGGTWTQDATKIAEIVADQLYNPRIVSWEYVVDMPETFPVIDHEYNLVDMVGQAEVVKELNAIAKAIADTGDSGLLTHIADKNNPHGVTKAQVGLSNVLNYGIATQAQAEAGTVNNAYMTPLRTAQAIDLKVAAANNHLSDKNNPHGVTKAQVNLGNVENYPIATQAQAEGGAANDVYMTPLRTKQAIDVQMVSVISHVNDKNNPHAVTKTQVGLSNVQNYPVATKAQAEAGTDNATYMTPLRTKEAIMALGSASIEAHLNDKDNPHDVSAAQIGAATKTELTNGLAEKLDKTGTAANATMAYGRTKAQLTADILGGKAADTAAFDGRDAAQYKAWVLEGKAADSGKLEGKTLDEVTTYVATQITDVGELKITAEDTKKFNGKTYQEAKDDILSGTAANASAIGGVALVDLPQHVIDTIEDGGELDVKVTNSERFDGKTVDEFMVTVRQQKVADSDKFAGRTFEQFFEQLRDAEVGDANRLEGNTLQEVLDRARAGEPFQTSISFSDAFAYATGTTVKGKYFPIGKSAIAVGATGADVQANLKFTDVQLSTVISNQLEYVKYRVMSVNGTLTAWVVDATSFFIKQPLALHFSKVTQVKDDDGNLVAGIRTLKPTLDTDTRTLEDVRLYAKFVTTNHADLVTGTLRVDTQSYGGMVDVDGVYAEPVASLPVLASAPNATGAITLTTYEFTQAKLPANTATSNVIAAYGIVDITTVYQQYTVLGYGTLKVAEHIEGSGQVSYDRDLVIRRWGGKTYLVNKTNKRIRYVISATTFNDTITTDTLPTTVAATPVTATVAMASTKPDLEVLGTMGMRVEFAYTPATGADTTKSVTISNTTPSAKLLKTEVKTGTNVTVKILPPLPTAEAIYARNLDAKFEFYIRGDLTAVTSFGNGNVSHFGFTAPSAFSVPNALPATVDSLELTFANCPLFNHANVVTWDVSNVKSFEKMFFNARAFNQNLSAWNTHNAIIRPYALDTNATAWLEANKPKFTSHTALGAGLEDLESTTL